MEYFGQKIKGTGTQLDQYLHERYIRTPFNNGSFLELGAASGVSLSNTKFFEDNMGFNRGVLIEPDPTSFLKLVKNRSNCECFNYAIHTENKSVEYFSSSKNSKINCVSHSDSKVHINKFHKSERWKNFSTLIRVQAERLDIILQKTKLEYLDFWSLDVEGSELQCLNSMDWSIPIGLVIIETSANQEQIDTIMINQGFSVIEKIGADSIYFNLTYFRKNLFHF